MKDGTTKSEDFVKLNPFSLRDEVYSLLRERILDHRYPPNYRFDLAALEEHLGISRTPLKEAMQRLEAEGLVEIKARRGTFVTRLDPLIVSENFDVRRILECAAARILIDNVTQTDVEKLKEINGRMVRLLSEKEYHKILPEYLEVDRKFHHFFVSLAANSRLSVIHSQINTHLAIARVGVSFGRDDSLITQSEHKAILKALDDRDGQELCRAMENHINLSKVRTLVALENDE
ncbi:MAG: GntR family transcriptional regulator [Candidatus Promineifilaceae bacterium]